MTMPYDVGARPAIAVGLLLTVSAIAAPAAAQEGSSPSPTAEATEPVVLHACYVPATGTVYRIKEPGLPDECSGPPRGPNRHVEFSWTEGVPGHLHANLNGLEADDHPQYLLADGSRKLAGDLSADDHKVTGLAAATESGDAVRLEQIANVLESEDAAGGDLEGTYPEPRVTALRGRALAEGDPDDGNVLAWDEQAGSWTPAAPAEGVREHGQLGGLDADDHPQYLLADGSRELAGDLSADGRHKVTGLAAATEAGDAVPFEQAVKHGDQALGDLGAAYPQPTVTGLQGRPVASQSPETGDLLRWDGNHWTPAAPATSDVGTTDFTSADDVSFPRDGQRHVVAELSLEPGNMYLLIGFVVGGPLSVSCGVESSFNASVGPLGIVREGEIATFARVFAVAQNKLVLQCRAPLAPIPGVARLESVYLAAVKVGARRRQH